MSRGVPNGKPASFDANERGVIRSSRNSNTLVREEIDSSGSPSTPLTTSALGQASIRNTSAVFSKWGGWDKPTTCDEARAGFNNLAIG